MNQTEEAERYYRKALKIWRRLAQFNFSAFGPGVATICRNLGIFEMQRGLQDSAKQYFEEALSIYEQFPHLVQDAQYCRDALIELQDA